jgi:plastocyanin
MSLLRRLVIGAVALGTAAALAACTPQDSGNNTLVGTKSPTPSASVPAPVPGGPVSLEAKDNEFVPKAIAAKAGDVTISFDNTGAAPHTFTSPELKVDQNVDAGKKTEISLKGVQPGTYKFVCKYHQSLGMVGELTVT